MNYSRFSIARVKEKIRAAYTVCLRLHSQRCVPKDAPGPNCYRHLDALGRQGDSRCGLNLSWDVSCGTVRDRNSSGVGAAGTYKYMAEREGFEPPIPVKVWPLSRRLVSTTHAPLRISGPRIVDNCAGPFDSSALRTSLRISAAGSDARKPPQLSRRLVSTTHAPLRAGWHWLKLPACLV